MRDELKRRLDTAREIRKLLGALVRECFTRPEPQPVSYLRCDRCGRVAAHLVETELLVIRGDDPVMPAIRTPPETRCPLCRHTQPRALGDDIPGTVALRCGHRWGWQLGWRRCATVHMVPAQAELVACPVCATTTDGPAAPGPRARP